MTVNDILSIDGFKALTAANGTRKISRIFCCDLLSIAMSKAPSGCCWITIMSNINSLAVAALTDCACIILAEGIAADDSVLKKAEAEGITLLSTDMPIFEAGLKIHEKM